MNKIFIKSVLLFSFLFISFLGVTFNIYAGSGIPVGTQPVRLFSVGTDLYTINYSSNDVSVIDTTTNTVTDTITVGSTPYSGSLVGTDLYINNMNGNVSVIDTTTNTVTDTIITSGSSLFSSTLVGTNLYINNMSSNDVSIIDVDPASPTYKTEITAKTVGAGPISSVAAGTNLYINNSFTNTVSVIDADPLSPTYNTVVATITVGNSPKFSTLIGTNVYVNNFDSNTVSVIDADPLSPTFNTVIDTVAFASGDGLTYSLVIGTNLYLSQQFSGGSVSVIDVDPLSPTYNTVIDFISTPGTPYFLVSVGTNLYTNDLNSTFVYVIDTLTNTLVDTIDLGVGSSSSYSISLGTDLYVANYNLNSVSIIDTITNTVSDVGSPVFVSATAIDDTITITYDEALDETSIPVVGDFIVNVNTNPVVVSGVNVTGLTVVLTLASEIVLGDVIDVSYTPGVDPIQDLVGNDAVALAGQAVTNNEPDCGEITLTGFFPNFSILAGTDLYVLNEATNNINVIDTLTSSIVADINTMGAPTFATLIGSHIYVSLDGAPMISVINTATRALSSVIMGGDFFSFSTAVGTNLYVGGVMASNVYVVDTSLEAIVDTIAVGNAPYPGVLIGTDLYVNNSNSGTVSVIDTTTNTVTDTIAVGNNPYYSTLVGTDLYVNNYNSGTISVIDTITNVVTTSIPIVGLPYSSTLVGTDLYVNDIGPNTISVIDTTTNTVTDTIAVGDTPRFSYLFNTDLFVLNQGSNDVSVIDTTTNTVTDTISVGANPQYATLVFPGLYISNHNANTISVIDLVTKNLIVCDVSYHTCTYTAGANGTLTGNALQYVSNGGNATAITAVPNTGYEFEDWSDAATNNPRTDTNVLGDITVTANFIAEANDPVVPNRRTTSGSYLSGYGTSLLLNTADTPPTDCLPGYLFSPSTGKACGTSSPTAPTDKFTFTKDLKYLMIDNDIKELQKFLNTHGYQLATIGAGSLGYETTKFGSLTKAAVIKFQIANNISPTLGYFGPITRGVVNGM